MARARPPADAPATAATEPHGKGKRKGEDLAPNSGEANASSGAGKSATQQERRVKITGRFEDPWSHGETYGRTRVPNTDSSSSSASQEVIQKLTMDQEAVAQKRAGQLEDLLVLKNKKLALRRKQLDLQIEQLEAEERDREDQIMMLDLDENKYLDIQREYFDLRKMEIIKKRRHRGGSSGAN